MLRATAARSDRDRRRQSERRQDGRKRDKSRRCDLATHGDQRADNRITLPRHLVHPTGVESPHNSSRNRQSDEPGDTISGTISDAATETIIPLTPDLAQIVAVWPDLPVDVRAALLSVAKHFGDTRCDRAFAREGPSATQLSEANRIFEKSHFPSGCQL